MTNDKLKITEMYAFVAENEDGEGVCATQIPGMGWMPLVGADMARMESFRPIAEQLSNASGDRIKILKFSVREEVDVILPDPTNIPTNVHIFDPTKEN